MFSLEPQGNDFTSFGPLGSLQILTMTNTETPADERERRKEGGGMRRLRGGKEKERESKTRRVWV